VNDESLARLDIYSRLDSASVLGLRGPRAGGSAGVKILDSAIAPRIIAKAAPAIFHFLDLFRFFPGLASPSLS
jgi:hypothetical protein